MSARSVAYVLDTADGSAACAVRDALAAQGLLCVVVAVLEHLAPESIAGSTARQSWTITFARDDAEPFTSAVGGDDRVVVPVAPAGDATIILVGPDEVGLDESLRRALAVFRWAAAGGSQPSLIMARGSDDVPRLTSLLTTRDAVSSQAAYDRLLEDHHEQAKLLVDLRFDYDQLLQREVELEKERDQHAQNEQELEGEVTEARSELASLLATRTLRYTSSIRRLYASMRSRLRR